MMPDDLFKKLPKFGKINFGTAKVHLCQIQFHFISSFCQLHLNTKLFVLIFLYKQVYSINSGSQF